MFYHWSKAAEETIERTHSTLWHEETDFKSVHMVKMISDHLAGKKQWRPISKQAHFPPASKQTVVTIAKETKTKKSFFPLDSLEPTMKEVSNILTAAMNKEEKNSG